MKFLQRNNVLPATFLLLSIGSVSYIVVSAINYERFFPALDQVNSATTISGITLQQDPLSTSGKVLNVHAIISNPSDYTGLTLASIHVSVYFVHYSPQGNTTLFAFLPLAAVVQGWPLNPRSQTPIDLLVPLTSQNATDLSTFASQGHVSARVSLLLLVNTFLVSVLGQWPLIVHQELSYS